MYQRKHCVVRGDMDKCLETKCSIHETWFVKEIKQMLIKQATDDMFVGNLNWLNNMNN